MKVLLKQDMDKLGRMGEVVDVAGGYARNFLLPRGLAVGVTRGRMKDVEEQKKVLLAKAERIREKYQGVAEKLKGSKIVIKERCSESGKLFGSITTRQLATEIESITGEEIDRHKITIVGDRIREIGTYQAKVKLHHDVVLDIDFEVEGEGFHPEEERAAEAKADDAAEPVEEAVKDEEAIQASETAADVEEAVEESAETREKTSGQDPEEG